MAATAARVDAAQQRSGTHPVLTRPALLSHIFKFVARGLKDGVKLLHVHSAWEDTAVNYSAWMWQRLSRAAGIAAPAVASEGASALPLSVENHSQQLFCHFVVRGWACSAAYVPALLGRLVTPDVDLECVAHKITAAGLLHLGGLKQLQSLNLSWCFEVNDAVLAQLGGLPQLQSLNLSFCKQFTDSGLQQLSALQQLQSLILRGCNQVTDTAGLTRLQANLPNLRTLNLAGCSARKAFLATAGATAAAAAAGAASPAPGDRTLDDDDDDAPDVKCYTSFDDMPISMQLVRGIYSYGFETPSAIQQRAIVPLINKGDVIAQAQSGTGKTGVVCIGLLARVDFRQKGMQALLLLPTRELAMATHALIARVGEYVAESSNPHFCQTLVGGMRVADDIRKIQGGAVVAVGTPGRVLDLMKRGAFRTDSMKLLVLDEADELLSAGFQEQIDEIFRFMPRDIQVCLFSATLPSDVVELAGKLMRYPTRILVRQEWVTLDGIKQFYVAVEEQYKLETLTDLFDGSVSKSVVFVNTRRKADYVSEQLNKTNHTVASIHSDMLKGERDAVLTQFRSGQSRVLVTTDLVARGIDVGHASIFVNYDLPTNMENYLHRIGRSIGRGYGRGRGVAINFVTQSDVPMLRQIEQHFHTVIRELPLDFASHVGD